MKGAFASGDCKRKSLEDIALGASRLGRLKRRLIVSSFWAGVELDDEGFGSANSDEEAANVGLSGTCIL